MLDRHLHPRIKPALNRLVSMLDRPGITPDGLTLTGFAIGVLALPFLALGWYPAALVAIVLNRLLDGLDGALARRRGLSDAGISRYRARLSVLRPGAVWLCAGSTGGKCAGSRPAAVRVYRDRQQFSGVRGPAAKHDIDNPGYAHKSFYYIGGLTEGTETIVLFALCCLFLRTLRSSRGYSARCAG